jgi:dihydroxy-acid dehydratase
VRKDIRPRDICTRAAFDNAIAGVAATGGSTNAVLHLLAMAREAELPLTIDDFDPSGAHAHLRGPQARRPYMAADVDRAGGIGVVAQRCWKAVRRWLGAHRDRPHLRRRSRRRA